MKIDSFEIKHNQYLCVVVQKSKRMYVFNLKENRFSININDKKDQVRIYSTESESDNPIPLEADFDLSPIVDAFMLANLEK